MTKMVPNHLLSQRAVLAVCTVLDRAGAMSETIKNDYGEDLLVQTQLRDSADNFHILVQVKGSRLKCKSNGDFYLSFDVGHLQRWVSNSSPVLVCVYDEVSRKIFAFYPRQKFSLWFLSTTNRNSIRISFGDGDVFNEDTAKSFIWKCRVEYFSRMLYWYESQIQDCVEFGHRKSIKTYEKEIGIIVFTFLRSISVIRDDEYCDADFVEMVSNCASNFAKKNMNSEEKLGIAEVFVLSLMGFFNKSTGCGLPTSLMLASARILSYYFRVFHPDEWQKADSVIRSSIQTGGATKE